MVRCGGGAGAIEKIVLVSSCVDQRLRGQEFRGEGL